jgi:hypothetical protein
MTNISVNQSNYVQQTAAAVCSILDILPGMFLGLKRRHNLFGTLSHIKQVKARGVRLIVVSKPKC